MSEKLYRACLNGELNTILSSLEDPASDFNYKDPSTGDTILHAVIHFHHNHPAAPFSKPIIEILLHSEKLPKTLYITPNHEGFIPLALALKKTSPNLELANIIHAHSKRNLNLFSIPTQNNPNPEKWYNPLYWAVDKQEYGFLEFYVKTWHSSATISFDRTPLQLAIENKDIRAYEILMRDIYNAHEMIQHYLNQRLEANKKLPIFNRVTDLKNIRDRIAHYSNFILEFDSNNRPLPITRKIINNAPRGVVSGTYYNYIVHLQDFEISNSTIAKEAQSTTALLQNKTQMQKRFLHLTLDCALSYFDEASKLTPTLQSEWKHFDTHFLVMQNKKLAGIDDTILAYPQNFSKPYVTIIKNIMLFYNAYRHMDFKQEMDRKKHLIEKYRTDILNDSFQDSSLGDTANAPLKIRPVFGVSTDSLDDEPINDFAPPEENDWVKSLRTLSWSVQGKKAAVVPKELPLPQNDSLLAKINKWRKK